MTYQAIKFGRLLLLSVLLGYLGGQILHEAGHWAILQLYRRAPLMSFTGLVQQDEPPAHSEGWTQFTTPDGEQVWLHLASLPGSSAEWIAMLAAGPLAQVAVMILGLVLARFGKREPVRVIGLLLALINSFGPILYQSRSMLGEGGGDEYFIAQFLGLPKYMIHLPILLISIAGFVVGLWSLAEWRTRLKWIGAVCIGFVGQGPLLMFANRITQTQVSLGNPLFRSVFGWSLPVMVVNVVVAFILVVVWMRW
ncbi:MAG: hypothetical protein D6796_00085 [Caldilineae bacterium]|nr:MAG: hypothetical protein D6796_00085 [Caldilineae bacterium]